MRLRARGSPQDSPQSSWSGRTAGRDCGKRTIWSSTDGRIDAYNLRVLEDDRNYFPPYYAAPLVRQETLDRYPEYTGTGFLVLHSPPQDTIDQLICNPEEVYTFVKRESARAFNLRWLKPIGFNNTYALMMREDLAEEMGVERVSDLGAATESRSPPRRGSIGQ